MQSTKQEQIVGYFIEEAREHLDTLEKGLLDLKTTVNDAESINELFRAAHSVKGGAAMLGFDSIHKTAHYLEDCLKLLKENAVEVDQKIETLLLKGFDALRELTDCIQGPFGFREDESQQVFAEVEPTFAQLQTYLKSLIEQGSPAADPGVQVTLPVDFATQVTDALRQILGVFKQAEGAGARQHVISVCDRLIQLAPEVSSWRSLIQMAQRAVSDPRNSFQTLAPIVIRDLKQSSDLLQARQFNAIRPSPGLQQLAASAPTTVSTQPQRITIPLEPQAAARVLVECFGKEQLKEIAQLLIATLKS